jgi:hypothetical protein
MLNSYQLTLKHDNGIINITTVADSRKKAKEKITKTENCPEQAIRKIKFLKRLT